MAVYAYFSHHMAGHSWVYGLAFIFTRGRFEQESDITRAKRKTCRAVEVTESEAQGNGFRPTSKG